MPYWDNRVQAMQAHYPDVKVDKYHIDILTANFVLHPDWFDVVVASNLFGDILSDLGPACTGTIGIAPSANINPEGNFPSLFEPVHGSAPDIAGKNIANPIGQIWCGAMMLEHLGYKAAGDAVLDAIERTLAAGEHLTRDLAAAPIHSNWATLSQRRCKLLRQQHHAVRMPAWRQWLRPLNRQMVQVQMFNATREQARQPARIALHAVRLARGHIHPVRVVQPHPGR